MDLLFRARKLLFIMVAVASAGCAPTKRVETIEHRITRIEQQLAEARESVATARLRLAETAPRLTGHLEALGKVANEASLVAEQTRRAAVALDARISGLEEQAMAGHEAPEAAHEHLGRQLADLHAAVNEVAVQVEWLETDRRKLEQRVLDLELRQRRY